MTVFTEETETAIQAALNKFAEDKPSTPKPEKALTLPEFGDAVVKVTAATGALSGLCYLFGFSIYNIHSSQFGVVSYELAAATYFIAGLSFMAFLLLPLASMALIPSAVTFTNDGVRVGKFVRFIGLLVALASIAGLALGSLYYAMGADDWNEALRTLAYIFAIFGVGCAIQGTWFRVFSYLRDVSNGWLLFVVGTVLATFLGLLLAFAVPIWATTVYPKMDHAFGGADLQGATVRVLFSPEAKTGGPALLAALQADYGIVLENEGFTPPLRLMEDSPTALYVLLESDQGERALRLPRAAIVGAVFSGAD